MLEYDDSAFYYFCLALLSFYMVPGTWYFLTKQVWPALVPPKDAEMAARTEVRPWAGLLGRGGRDWYWHFVSTGHLID
jgi:hypothetical protein